MTNTPDDTSKTHYICQTYVGNTGGQAGLKIGKQFQYSNATEAQNRAEREFLSENCAGADAYMVVEDAGSGEVSSPEFLVRLGQFPELDDF